MQKNVLLKENILKYLGTHGHHIYSLLIWFRKKNVCVYIWQEREKDKARVVNITIGKSG